MPYAKYRGSRQSATSGHVHQKFRISVQRNVRIRGDRAAFPDRKDAQRANALSKTYGEDIPARLAVIFNHRHTIIDAVNIAVCDVDDNEGHIEVIPADRMDEPARIGAILVEI